MKKALITGVTGQDGSYLSEFLLEKGYEVHGIIRRSSVDFRERIAHLEGKPHFHLHYADMSDSMSLVKLVGLVQPDEIYNLAAQSHVQVSFDAPEFTADVDATGVLRVLEAVRTNHLEKTCRIYQASTSELYGKVEEVPQNENTPFHPYSPYAVAKLYGFWIVKEYREAYNMQPRERTPWRDLRHPQDHPCCRPHQPRPARLPLPWQHGQPTRLGLCQGLCRVHVAHPSE